MTIKAMIITFLVVVAFFWLASLRFASLGY